MPLPLAPVDGWQITGIAIERHTQYRNSIILSVRAMTAEARAGISRVYAQLSMTAFGASNWQLGRPKVDGFEDNADMDLEIRYDRVGFLLRDTEYRAILYTDQGPHGHRTIRMPFTLNEALDGGSVDYGRISNLRVTGPVTPFEINSDDPSLSAVTGEVPIAFDYDFPEEQAWFRNFAGDENGILARWYLSTRRDGETDRGRVEMRAFLKPGLNTVEVQVEIGKTGGPISRITVDNPVE